MPIKISKTSPFAITPRRGTSGAAGADLFACIPEGSQRIKIPAGSTALIDTGIAMAIPSGYVGLVFPRSGWAVKRGLTLANAVGVIDEDYRGSIKVGLHNQSKYEQTVEHDDRIAQIVIIPYMKSDFDIVDELDSTERGEGGFGSTGK